MNSKETLVRIVTEQLGVDEEDIESEIAMDGDACLIGNLGACEEDCEAIRASLHQEVGIPLAKLANAHTFGELEELLPRAT